MPPQAGPVLGLGSTKDINDSLTKVRSSSCSISMELFFLLIASRGLTALLRERFDMFPKLKFENREPFEGAVPADSGDVDDVDVDGEGDGDDEKAVRSLRSELRGCRDWNLFACILSGLSR